MLGVRNILRLSTSSCGRINHLQRVLYSKNMAGESLKYPSENALGDAHGYVTGDKTSKQGLIVIQEWWGQNDQIRNQGREIGTEGNFYVLVPDLYRGKLAEDKETAGHYMSNLDWKGAVSDIAAGAKFLKTQGCEKVGVTGFCMGGALSLACAALISDLISAAAPFYGIPSAELADLTTIKIPIQAHFAKYDEIANFSSKKEYDPLRQKLESAGVNLEFHEYDAKHAFCNPENRIGDNYNNALATLAMERLREFMKKHLA